VAGREISLLEKLFGLDQRRGPSPTHHYSKAESGLTAPELVALLNGRM
jgi:hypothetical protein